MIESLPLPPKDAAVVAASVSVPPSPARADSAARQQPPSNSTLWQAWLTPLREHPLLRPVVALALLLLVDVIFLPGFLHLEIKDGHLYGPLIDILNRAAPLMLASLGMSLVIATRGIDVSIGAVVAIAATVAAVLVNAKQPLPVAYAAALGTALLCGAWNGILVAGLKLQPIIATLILMVAGRGLAQLMADGQIITVYEPSFFVLGSGYLLGLPVSLWVVVAVALITTTLLKKTALGLFIQAVGLNPVASRLAGLRTVTLIFGCYVFAAICAGAAGLMIASNIKSADANNAGLLLELDAILAVTLGGASLAGGKYHLAGSLVGALIIQTLTTTIYSLGVPPEVNMVVKALVVFLLCILQSNEWRAMLRRWTRRSPPGGRA
ncbi:simple sugar transport system permease protein [Roseateles terrae]|uniref:Simple sugar transport system permease protein n=1 Tax=Roseateles terrae TaxID=431060 RepID=A0ABR6GMA3_9BURK|nr:simple sugar transport system permease protein [Roseateles terrae]